MENENLRADDTAHEMTETGVEEFEVYGEYEDCPSFMEMNPYEDEICPYEQIEMLMKKSFMDNIQKLMAVINQQKSQPAYEEFLNFLKEEGLKNPMDDMVESLSDMMQSSSECVK